MKFLLRIAIAAIPVVIFFGCSSSKPPVQEAVPSDTTTAAVDTTTAKEEAYSNEKDTLKEVSLSLGKVVDSLSAPEQLTTDPFDNGIGNYSPDGSQIAFQSNRDGRWQIYSLDLNAPAGAAGEPAAVPTDSGTTPPSQGNVHHLIDSPFNDENPIFTLDGKGILFVSDRDRDAYSLSDFQRNIYLYSLSEKTVTRLTDSPADDWFPMPYDQESYLFLTERDGPAEYPDYVKRNSLYKGYYDGRPPQQLIGTNYDPSSPIKVGEDAYYFRTNNGRLVYYVYGQDSAAVPATGDSVQTAPDSSAVAAASANGLTPITPAAMRCGIAVLDKPANLIVMTAFSDTQYKLFLLNPDAHQYQTVDTITGEIRYPRLSPDGGSILFSEEVSGHFQLFRIVIKS